MGKKRYHVESDFEDDDDDLLGEEEEDLSDSDNPIIRAAFQDDDDDDLDLDDKDVFGGDDDDDEEDEEDEDDDLDADDDSDEEDEEDDDEKSKSTSEDEEDDEADQDDEESSYSKRVQKRIERERQLRLKAERDADLRIRRLENQVKLRDAKDELEAKKAKTESEIRKLRKEKRDAIEEGDTDRQIEIDDKILDLRTEIRQAEADFKQLEKELTAEPEDDDVSGLPEAAQRWLEKYPQFYTNKEFSDAVRIVDKLVARRGFDKNTDRYYQEIEKILAPQFPKIIKRNVRTTTKREQRADLVRKKRKHRGAVGGTARAGTRTSGKSRGVIRLTREDKRMMENFGLDPTNKEHVREWARNKIDD